MICIRSFLSLRAISNSLGRGLISPYYRQYYGLVRADGKPVVYVKSDEGDVYSLSAGEEPRHEKIEGSGVYSEDAAGLGYTNRIVTINKTLL